MGAGWSTSAIVLTTVVTVAILTVFFILFCKNKIDDYFPYWTDCCCCNCVEHCCQSLKCCTNQNDDKSLDLSANFNESSTTSTTRETRLEVENELLGIPATDNSMANSHSRSTPPYNGEPLINSPILADMTFTASTDEQLPPPSYEDIKIFDNFRHIEPTAPPLEV